MTQQEVGKRIKEARKQAGYKQREVAAKMGIVLQQYQTYESGRYQLDYDKMITICKILNISADYLLGLSEY